MTAAEDVDAAVTFATWARLQGLRGDEPGVTALMEAWFALYLFGQCLRSDPPPAADDDSEHGRDADGAVQHETDL